MNLLFQLGAVNGFLALRLEGGQTFHHGFIAVGGRRNGCSHGVTVLACCGAVPAIATVNYYSVLFFKPY